MSAGLDWDWELEMQFNPKELGELYELYFFLGPVPSSVSDWRTSPLRLFEPITSNAHDTTTEFRLLNGYLEERYEGELGDNDVIPYLRKNLSWGVKKRSHDEQIENSRLESLKVIVHGPDGSTTLGDKTE